MSDDCALAQNGETSEVEDDSPQTPQELWITAQETNPKAASVENLDEEIEHRNPVTEELEEEQEPIGEETPMDWEDLTREQWSESDRLLQKVEKVGSKVLQRDFLSTIGQSSLESIQIFFTILKLFLVPELVHVSHYKKAEETLAQRKLRAVEGKKVITTGPWQIIDIPTKVLVVITETIFSELLIKFFSFPRFQTEDVTI